MTRMVAKAAANGSIALLTLLIAYVTTVSLVSGWDFMLEQLSRYWFYTSLLAAGFGIQVGLYTYLKNVMRQHKTSRRVVTATGMTTSASMIACCAHYLVTILPILAVTGITAFVAQYQVQLFWLGLVLNLFGIGYIIRVIDTVRRHHEP